METALQKIDSESTKAIQLAQPNISDKLYKVARKLEHTTEIDKNELGKMTLIAFDTFIKIQEALGIKNSSKKETVFPINEMYLMAYKVSVFQPAVIADREKLAPLLETLDGISGKLPD